MRPLDLFAGLLARLPVGWTEAIAAGGGWFLGSVIRHRRSEVVESMKRTFPDRTDGERSQLLNRMYRNLGRTAAESVRLACGRADHLIANTRFVGLDRVDKLLEEGKGVLILSAHLGNWELFGAAAARSGYPSTVVVKEIKGRMMNDFITQGRARYGNHMLPRQNSFRDCLRVLKGNGILGMMLDQNMIRSEGIFVDFLGKPACTTPGLAYLSAQSGAPVVPMACIRVSDGHEVRIGKPFPAPPDREPETIRRATQGYTHAIEAAIRTDPDQWIWIHRRWRTQPLAYADGGRTGDRSSG